MYQSYPIGHIVSHRTPRNTKILSNPATHDPIAVFLPHSFNPLLPSPSNPAARSSPDGFELETAAIKLFAEIQSGRWSGVGRD
jgi:hypothetical protein